MRILVLGATGTLGRAGVEGLVGAGHGVRVLAHDVGKARLVARLTRNPSLGADVKLKALEV
jgi:uncharacterized protein YbjT (DUF2867 family)